MPYEREDGLASRCCPEESPIQDISDYIGRVDRYIRFNEGSGRFPVYRGEPKLYPKPCRPGIFRHGVLAENRFFEKNLFDAMRQSGLTGEKRYLDNAIDAQHGEFPSRLLDVTYNCLIALYFAVTPSYRREEGELDEEDGRVFILFPDEIFSPSAQNTNQAYEAIINRDQPWLQSPLFRKNHKFIDHIKLCPRIIAQQGAFILFQGDVAADIPEGMYRCIQIPGGSKKRLREQLSRLFGIHTGSIYPETSNLVRELTGKSARINTEPFSCENELRYALRQLGKELDYYLDYAISRRRALWSGADGEARREELFQETLDQIVCAANIYREGLIAFVQDYAAWSDSIREHRLWEIIAVYNRQLRDFDERMAGSGCGVHILEGLQLRE